MKYITDMEHINPQSWQWYSPKISKTHANVINEMLKVLVSEIHGTEELQGK